MYAMKGVTSKELYAYFCMGRLDWRANFKTMTLWAKIICKLKGNKGKLADWEKEAWRMTLASSQEHFPVTTGPKWTIQVVQGISCRVRRLDDEDARFIFGSEMTPIISQDGPLLGKLVRLALRGELQGTEGMHRTNGSTVAYLSSGKFGVTTKGIERYIQDFSFGC